MTARLRHQRHMPMKEHTLLLNKQCTQHMHVCADDAIAVDRKSIAAIIEPGQISRVIFSLINISIQTCTHEAPWNRNPSSN